MVADACRWSPVAVVGPEPQPHPDPSWANLYFTGRNEVDLRTRFGFNCRKSTAYISFWFAEKVVVLRSGKKKSEPVG